MVLLVLRSSNNACFSISGLSAELVDGPMLPSLSSAGMLVLFKLAFLGKGE
jgi:hypothetical protein